MFYSLSVHEVFAGGALDAELSVHEVLVTEQTREL